MNDMSTHLRRALRGALILSSIALLVWAIKPDARQYAAGFMLGLFFSMVNGWYLALKTRQVIAVLVENSGKRVGLGFIVRAAMSVLAVYIAVEREEQFDLAFTIIGLVYSYVAFYISGIISLIKNKD